MVELARAAEVDLTPSLKQSGAVIVDVATSLPPAATAISVPVRPDGPVPDLIGLDRATLATAGFSGDAGQSLLLLRPTGPSLVAVGIGDPAGIDAARLRDAAAAFARAASKHADLAVSLENVPNIPLDIAAQAVVEGVLLARYHYDVFRREPPGTPVARLTLVGRPEQVAALTQGAERGKITAAAAQLARDLANAPATHLTATRMADVAEAIAAERGLDVEVFDRDQLVAMGCGGLLGVNAGSAEPPRLIKLTYRPKNTSDGPGQATGHLAMVGKGIMYDSGGLSLKPSDASHQAMKMDMSGAAAILAAMSALAALDCKAVVTGYLMCTDNMPSGTATRLGDVLTIRGGTTVEVSNADAEGRLVLADGLVLAIEESPDAIVDVATLTGAMMRALGEGMAGVIGNNQPFVDQVLAAAERTDEQLWQMPLNRRYRPLLDSPIADMRNIGGENAGAIVGALFLADFVGTTPWAHVDIAGTRKSDADDSWRPRGAIAFGTRLLLDLALEFKPPAA
jgi:leucyl aminopeptidase